VAARAKVYTRAAFAQTRFSRTNLAQVHTPATHVCIGLHRLPQRPQCAALALVSVSQPVLTMPSQFAQPALQAPIAHTPAAHVADAREGEQARLHAPQ